MEFAVRRQRGDEAGAVREVITAAFADGGRVTDLAEALRRRSDRQCSLVAVERAETDEGVEDAKRVESATDEAVMGAGDTARGERVVGVRVQGLAGFRCENAPLVRPEVPRRDPLRVLSSLVRP